MGIWKFIIFVIVIIVLSVGVFNLRAENKKLQTEIDDVFASLSELERENTSLEKEITYFSNPENLLKELKSQFNYREAGEELMIVVPDGNG